MRGVAVVAMLLLATACQSEDPSATGTRSASGLTESDVRARCLSGIPDDAPVRAVSTLRAGSIALPAVDIGPETASRTALVLLPQINAGLCGWGRFATYAARHGVSSVLVDVCGYGESDCGAPGMDDIAAQVDLAAQHLRDEGASMVVVVGASMGGSNSVRAVAGGADVEGWADLSGPPTWETVRLLDIADQVDLPGFIGYARSDGDRAFHEAQVLARRTGAEFADGGYGHGWELLQTPLGRTRPFADRLLAFVASVE